MTPAIWDKGTVDKAATSVRAYYAPIGFDPPAALAKWHAKAEIGDYVVGPLGRATS